MNKTKYFQTVYLIKKCYNFNSSIPKGYGTRSSDYKYWYDQKVKMIQLIISNIKNYALNIKYGQNDGITYFSFNGEQFSFHGYYGANKSYNGNWVGTVRKSKVLNKNNKIIGEKILHKSDNTCSHMQLESELLDD